MPDDPQQLRIAFEALTKQIEALTEVNNKLLKDTVDANERVAASQNQSNENLQQEIDKRKLILESQKAQTTETKKQAEEAGRYAEKQKLLNDYYSQTIENLQEEISLRKRNGDEIEELVEDLKEAKNAQKNLNKETEEGTKSIEKYSGMLKSALKGDLKSVLSGVGKDFVKNNKFIQKQIGNFEGEMAKMGSKGSLAVGGFAAGMVGAAASIKLLKAEFDLALEIENVRREFMKTTGATKEFSMSIIEAGEATRAFDREMKKAFEASKALRSGFTDFTMINKSERGEIQNTTTVLSALGIAGADVAKGLQLSTKALSETATGAAQTQLELNALARDIGVAPSKMAADFAAAGPQLAKLGRDGTKAFKDLAVASKITGLEVSRLLAITEKFDTFEGAAEQAGKLNAALGGNFVNAMELMTATDPAERFGMIRDSVLDAGLAFDDMSYYQRKFYADAMGLQDVSELALVLSGNMDSLNGEIGKTSADYENAAKMAADFQSVQEQLKNALYSLLPVITPLVESIGEFAAVFADFVTTYGDEIRMFLGLVLISLGAMAIAAVATLGPIMAVISAIAGLISIVTGLRLAFFVDHSSPTLFDGLLETAGRFDKLTGATKKFGVETEDTTTSVGKMRGSMNKAAAGRAGAQTIANSNVMSSAVDNAVNNTTNNYGQQSNQNIIVELDGKKVGEGVMGKFARSAAMV
jgi:hypothetical protein